jgi:asparagine synthase (glutamine-hydrolysing)
MDSSLIAESAARQGRLSRAYCLDFEETGFSEWPRADRVARSLGIPLERVRFGPESVREFVSLVEHADDPLADSSALPVWVISQAAAGGNKVVLGGDGGDELFGGYLTYQASLLHARFVKPLPAPLKRLFSSAASRLPTSEGKVSTTYKLMRFARAATAHAGAPLQLERNLAPAEAAPAPPRAAREAAAGAHTASSCDRARRTALADLQLADVGSTFERHPARSTA